jgi:hypothetical protein
MGAVETSLGEYDQAVVQLRRALSLAPDNAEAHINLCNALRMQGQDIDGAILHGRRGAELRPSTPEAHMNLANALGASGDIAGAVMAYERTLALKPDLAEVHRHLSLYIDYEPDHPHLKSMRILAAGKWSDTDRMHLNFALAKAEEDCGNITGSFRLYREANMLKRRATPYDGAAPGRMRETIVAVDTRLQSSGAAVRSNDGPSGIFIVGLPRCGSTLTEQIVSLNPLVHDLGETGLLSDAVARSGITGTPADDLAALQDMAGHYAKAVLKRSGGNRLVTDKALHNFWYCGLIARTVPGARIVHMTRNPMDQVLSVYRNYFVNGNDFAYDLTEIAAYFHEHMLLMAEWKLRYPGLVYTCDYDTLVTDPESSIPALIAFCGFPWDPAYLRPQHNPRMVFTASVVQVRQPI